MIARNGNALVSELITHIDSIPTTTMSHSELHRALQGPEYTSVSLGIADPQGNAQTVRLCLEKSLQDISNRLGPSSETAKRQEAGTRQDHQRSYQGRGERVRLSANGGGCFCETLA